MLIEELNELINYVSTNKTERQDIEVKAANKGCPKRLYDTLSSFSNQDSGGIILFGLDESMGFEKVGVYDLQNLQKKVTEQCNQMEPPVRVVFTATQIDDKLFCSAEIPGLDLSERPCYYKGTGKAKGSYIRVGDADMPMTDYELYSYEAFRKHAHDDERVVERAKIELLDQEKISNYIYERRLERPKFAQLTKEQTMEMLNITRDGMPTLAAVMNFCIYPQGFYPQLGIIAIVVPGEEIGDVTEDHSRFVDNRRIEGTISDMVEEAVAFCKRNIKIRTVIDPETGKRKDRTEYPIEAIREVILNAVIHRDYSHFTEGTPIQLNIFSNRIEVHSPGNLYGRMTVEQLGKAKPDLRNPGLAVMTEMLSGAENRYSGIPTIRREMKAYHLPEPKFENRRNEFVVTLYNTKFENNDVNTKMKYKIQEESVQSKLLAFCMIPRSRKEIAKFLKIKTQSFVMSQYIRPLLEQRKLQMTIPDKPRSKNQKFVTIKNESIY